MAVLKHLKCQEFSQVTELDGDGNTLFINSVHREYMLLNAVQILVCSDFVFTQAGKHEAIVKNVHDLLAKLAWDFSPEQLDHLFDCFKVLVNVVKQYSFIFNRLIHQIYE